MLNGFGSGERKLVALGILTVKKTERVLVKALAAGIAKLVTLLFIIRNERLTVNRAALTAAN
jgi:hypothetical protein